MIITGNDYHFLQFLKLVTILNCKNRTGLEKCTGVSHCDGEVILFNDPSSADRPTPTIID